MKISELNKVFESYGPSDETRRSLLCRIQSEHANMPAHFGSICMRFAIAGVALVLAFGCCLALRRIKQVPTAPVLPLPSAQTAPGITVLAYQAGEEGAQKAVALQLDVQTPLPSYQMTSEAVPGFPFQIVWQGDEENAEVTVDAGSLLRWDPATGCVQELGKSARCANGETIYYTPMEEGQSVTGASLCVILAEQRQSVAIWGQQERYFASLMEPGLGA